MPALTFATAFWAMGGWIQSQANTLAIWCMFAQAVPKFQDSSRFVALPTLCKTGTMNPAVHHPHMMGFIAALPLVINVIVFVIIWMRALALHINPYTYPVFVGSKDYGETMGLVTKGRLKVVVIAQ